MSTDYGDADTFLGVRLDRFARLRETVAGDYKATFGLTTVVLFVLAAVFAPELAPSNPQEIPAHRRGLRQQLDQRLGRHALPGAGLPHDRMDLAGGYREVNAAHGLDAAVEGDVQIAQLQSRLPRLTQLVAVAVTLGHQPTRIRGFTTL